MPVEGLLLPEGWSDWFSINLLRALIILSVGWWLSSLLIKITERWLQSVLPENSKPLWLRLGFWLLFGLFIAAALHQMGFKLNVLLGAAGVLSVAVGFASQTSMSNLISGLFVLSEKSFVIGDVIQMGTTTGEVVSIDLLSVKLKTFDNLFVRIPNENLIKSEVTTLTKFPIRRYDLKVGIAYCEDIGQARQVLMDVAAANPLCLEEPKPLVILLGFGESSIDIQFSVWGARANWLEFRNSLIEQVKLALDEAGIEIPFPHRTLYAGKATDPLPVQLLPQQGKNN